MHSLKFFQAGLTARVKSKVNKDYRDTIFGMKTIILLVYTPKYHTKDTYLNEIFQSSITTMWFRNGFFILLARRHSFSHSSRRTFTSILYLYYRKNSKDDICVFGNDNLEYANSMSTCLTTFKTRPCSCLSDCLMRILS